MKNKNTILFSITVGAFFAVIAYGVYYMYFEFNLAGDCERNLIYEVTSTSSPYSAQVLLVGCGATSRDATWINVKNVITKTEQVMISLDNNHTKTCNVAWENPRDLSVTCDEILSQTFSYSPDFEKVHMTYHFAPK